MRPPSQRLPPKAGHAATGLSVASPGSHEGIVTYQNQPHSPTRAADVNPTSPEGAEVGYVDRGHPREHRAVVFISWENATEDGVPPD